MSLSIDRFGEFFGALYKYKGKPLEPFPWQTRLAKRVFTEGWPDCIDLPTASGKTAAIDIAVFALACQAGLETKARTVGRRIFFAVNRRMIVDEAFDRADALANTLLKAEENSDIGILGEVARALRSLNGESDLTKAPPLDRVQLRGGIYRDRAWARSITQPIVVCTTADQLGSRLLFRGYGVTASSAPIHAALCGCDSLVLLDEAHVTRAFSQTMQLLTRYQSQHSTAPKMRFVQMTATPAGEVKNRFALDDADRSHPILKRRQEASKPVTLVKLEKKKPIAGEIVNRAFGALSDSRKAVGIIVNRVQTAREIERSIQEEIAKRAKKDETFNADVYLVIGRMRPIDRDDLQEKLGMLVGPYRPDVLEKPVFIVATQCLEVGADYDFDALITECASIDALRQRVGRLNRKGRPIEVVAVIVTNEESLKGDDPIYGDAIKHTWEWLWSKKDANDQCDFGISKFVPLWKDVEKQSDTYLKDDCPKPLLSPAQSAAVLLPAHLDALCQTSPQPVPSPDVSYFIHGPQRDNAEVNVCWRADLGPDGETAIERWPEIVRLLPPTSPECMTVPLSAMKRWMGERFKIDADADVPTAAVETEDKRDHASETQLAHVLIWRYGRTPGDDAERRRRLVGFVTNDPREIKPGDTIVMPVSSRNWLKFGHIPNATQSSYEKTATETEEEFATRCALLDHSVDVAERAMRQSKLRLAIRLHNTFPGRSDLRELRAGELRPLLRTLLETEIADADERRRALAVLDSRFDRHRYDTTDDDNPETKHNELIVFRSLLEPPNLLELPTSDDDDGEDDLSEGNQFIPFSDHTQHVEDRLALSLDKLHLNELDSTVRASAPHHDIGKLDTRFQAMLAGVTPYEAMMLPKLLAKGDGVRRTKAERDVIFKRAMYPRGFRHEMLSIELIKHLKLELKLKHRDLLLHLIAAHHGYARPFAPVCFDDAIDDELRSLRVNGHDIASSERKAWTPSHRLDSGIAERFWKLTREHGWWGLAWLESILRLADQQASAAEQEGTINE